MILDRRSFDKQEKRVPGRRGDTHERAGYPQVGGVPTGGQEAGYHSVLYGPGCAGSGLVGFTMDQLCGCLVITVCCMALDVLALDWLDDPGQGQFEKQEQRVPGR